MKEAIFKRKTNQREVILDIVRNTKCHPCVDNIYDEAREIMPRISKGTVYRNIKLLSQAGMVLELSIDHNVLRYDGSTHTHGHLLCENCGAVTDIELTSVSELEQQVKQQGYKINNTIVEFYGLCTKCNIKKDNHSN